MDMLSNLHQSGKCCISERPLSTSKHLNVVPLNYKANWPHPQWGNIILGSGGMALAIIHDDYMQPDGTPCQQVKFAIETNSDGDIFYHPVNKLQTA